MVGHRLKMLRGENAQTRHFVRGQRDPNPGPSPRHSGRATRDPESICFPMDSRVRGNDGNRVGGHYVKQAAYSSCPSERVQGDPELDPNPRHSGRATRDPESSCFPMDSLLRGNDGDQVGGHGAMQNELTGQACALDAATRLRRTFGRQVAANLKELGYGN